MSMFCSAPLNRGAFSKAHAAEHWCWLTAHLYEQQTSADVIAVTQGCCEPVLQSSPELWGMQHAKISLAVHWWVVTAHIV